MIVEMIKDRGAGSAHGKACILLKLSKVGFTEELKLRDIKLSVEEET